MDRLQSLCLRFQTFPRKLPVVSLCCPVNRLLQRLLAAVLAKRHEIRDKVRRIHILHGAAALPIRLNIDLLIAGIFAILFKQCIVVLPVDLIAQDRIHLPEKQI